MDIVRMHANLIKDLRLHLALNKTPIDSPKYVTMAEISAALCALELNPERWKDLAFAHIAIDGHREWYIVLNQFGMPSDTLFLMWRISRG
jgi:hypothetical protein